jgi:hypothetical protein
MKALVAFVLATGLSAAAALTPALADCPYPEAPKGMPDGKTASKDEMLAMRKSVQDFDAATNAYLNCIQKDHDDAMKGLTDSDADKKKKAQLDHIEAEKQNAAQSQDQTLADKFNEQIRIFKAKSAPAN